VSWTTELVREGLSYAMGTGQIPVIDSLQAALDAIPDQEGQDDPIADAVRHAMTLEVGYPQQLAKAVLRAWLIGAVARIVQPGYKVDSIMVVMGPQGIGKSTFARRLALDERWFTDAVPLSRLDDRDAIMHLQGRHVVEFPELAGLQRAELEAVKAWITRQVDVYRAPYARRASERPRRFVAIATSNRNEFLTDVQNRRFWLLRVTGLDPDWIAANRQRLYAHARRLFHAGMRPLLGQSAATELAREHDRAIEEHPWEQAIVAYARRKKILTFEGIFRQIGKPLASVGRKDMRIVNDIIRRRLPGFQKAQVRIGGVRQWAFRRSGRDG
jgi:predicted P-loop ATPase